MVSHDVPCFMVKSPKESHLDPNYLVSKVSHSPCFPTHDEKKTVCPNVLSQQFSIYVPWFFPQWFPCFFTSFHIFPWDSTIFPPFFHQFPRCFPFPAGSPGGSPRAALRAPPETPRRGGRRQRRTGDGASGGTRSGANPLLGKFRWMVTGI